MSTSSDTGSAAAAGEWERAIDAMQGTAHIVGVGEIARHDLHAGGQMGGGRRVTH